MQRPARSDERRQPAGPRSCGELFRLFNRMALQGFGGVLAVAQIELVERSGWLTREDFVETPRPPRCCPDPTCNLALMVGDRCFGWRARRRRWRHDAGAAGDRARARRGLRTLGRGAGGGRCPARHGRRGGRALVISTALKLGFALESNPPGCRGASRSGADLRCRSRSPAGRSPGSSGLGSVAVITAWRRLR